MLIHELLERSAARRPEALLLIDGERRATYAEVDGAANRLARLLADRGVRRGDRVGLMLPNSLEYVVAYYAALKCGALAVALHWSGNARALRHLLADCGARALVAGNGAAARVAEAATGLPELRLAVLGDDECAGAELPGHVRTLSFSAAAEHDPSPPPGRRGIDLDRAMIVYTSGSTGHPRGAILSHLNVVSNTRSILSYLELTERDRVLVLLPFPYVYGKSLLNTHVAAGGSLVLHGSLLFPNAVLDRIDEEAVTGLSGVPSTFALLLNRSDLERRELPSLRYATQAGGGMPAAHIERLVRALPGARVFVMYGATEASARLSYLDPERLADKLGSIGRAIPNVELSVRRPDGTEADVDEVGEIVARGSNITEGYWGDEEATREVLGAHGYHTGDLARRDEEGFLWIAGRKREMIKSGAHRISPREIEDVLLESPDVDEAAVVGVPEEFLGEAVVAHVTLRPGSSREGPELVEFCRQRLPAHKAPRHVVVRRDLPRHPSGKIDKRSLRDEGLPEA